MFYVMNHYTRDPGFVVDQIEAQGYRAEVHTDYSDYYRKRDEFRYRGVVENYQSCLADSPHLEWRIIFHDDMVIPEGALDKMLYILQEAPKTGISFYNPNNNGYRAAVENGHHVLQSLGNYWLPAFAWPKEYVDDYLNWSFVFGQPYGKESEDSLVWTWAAESNKPMHAIIPSLTQHDGYNRSTHGNPPKSGKNWRYAENYIPEFDPAAIDWEYHFANPYKDKMIRKA